MDVSMVNNDFYLSGMAALVGDIDSKRVNASTLPPPSMPGLFRAAANHAA